MVLEILPSALKHGVTPEAIVHAVKFLLFADEDFQDSDPPKVLILGPNEAGNLIEVIGRLNNNDTLVVFHAMVARSQLLRLLTDRDQS